MAENSSASTSKHAEAGSTTHALPSKHNQDEAATKADEPKEPPLTSVRDYCKILPRWMSLAWILAHTFLAVQARDQTLRDEYSLGPAMRVLAGTSWLFLMQLILSRVPSELIIAVHHLITSSISSGFNTYLWYIQLDDPSYEAGLACILARDQVMLQVAYIICWLNRSWIFGPLSWVLYWLVLPTASFSLLAWLLLKTKGVLRDTTLVILGIIRINMMRLFWWKDFRDVMWMAWIQSNDSSQYKMLHRLGERKKELHIELPRFEYRPLKPNQIRLLVIKPCGWGVGQILETTIAHVNLSELPAYEAISYHWGSSEKTDEIFIDYHSFFLTKSSIDVLRCRRRWFKPRTIWLDAICINQSDPEEKASQVQLMRHIYANAYRVVVFPSFEPELRLVEGLINEEASNFRRFRHTDSSFEFRPLLANGNFIGRWKWYKDLLYKPYWSRAWIVQEIAMASDVQLYLHGFYVPWRVFLTAVSRFGDPFKYGQLELAGHTDESVAAGGKSVVMLLNTIANIDALRKKPALNVQLTSIQNKKHKTLEALYECAFNAEASDPRDYLFSVVGLASDVTPEHHSLIPDYTKPNEEVFEDAARYFFVKQTSPSLFLLGRAGIGFNISTKRVPSWVPDPSDKRIGTPHNQVMMPRTFLACSERYNTVSVTYRGASRLTMQGILCDELKLINEVDLVDPLTKPGTRLPTLPMTIQKSRFLNKNIMFMLKHGAPGMAEDMYRIFSVDHLEDNRIAPEWRDVFDEYVRINNILAESKDYMDMVRRGDSAAGHSIWAPNMPGKLPQQSTQTNAFNMAMCSACFGRRVAVTKTGRACLVPAFSRPGDQIFIPFGAVSPFIVRKIENSDDFQLVGEAYVHGIMYGEAVDEDVPTTSLTFR